MSAVPCSSCRERHQKCDRRQPICGRCEAKGLECNPAKHKPVFRHGSTANLDANFKQDQTWVNSRLKTWRAPARSSTVSGIKPTAVVTASSPQPGVQLPFLSQASDINSSSYQNIDQNAPENYAQNDNLDSFRSGNEGSGMEDVSSHSSIALPTPPVMLRNPDTIFDDQSSPESRLHQDDQITRADNHVIDQGDLTESDYQTPTSRGSLGDVTSNVQESCLLLYFIEELSPWFDHCDDRRHFQFVVPRRAAQCSALKNAVFALSSRHLSRLPQYMTPDGVFYRGQSLPNLTHTTSVEYMLQCIPELVKFPEIQDSRDQENIMAAAVILRQYEEIEEELEEGDERSYASDKVNFLAITQTIIDRMISTPLHYSLAAAAYWIAIRQEVYFGLTRQRCPQFRLGTNHWQNISVVNTVIVFTGQVARWRWGMKKAEEWTALKRQHQHLSEVFRSELQPILENKPNRASGDIFPTIWYCYDSQVTAIQHLKLSEMILIAESPYLENARGAVHRKAEAQVRSIVLTICGIALNHPRCQPAMVNAVISITLYGGYFTEPEDREALLGIIHRTTELHSWPMRKPCQHLLDQWELVDNAEF